jgi:hypothetical protein
VFFDVDVPDVAEPFPTASVVTVSAIVVVVVGLLVYFKKRKHQSIPSSTISNSN